MRNRDILFIEGAISFIHQAIVNKLEAADFTVHRVVDDISSISRHSDDSDLVLYYPTGSIDYIETVTIYLLDLCRDDSKTLCIIGDKECVAAAMRTDEFHVVSRNYVRPVDLNEMVNDMCLIADAKSELKRKKSILIVDDDPDFLKIMTMWLEYEYNVFEVRSGEEALYYLETQHPDLILLDYEMPEMDGYEVLDNIRGNLDTANIPVIFLTGKDDRESVLRIIKRRPDGYLLKTQRKEDLLDSLSRFFTESILKIH